MIKMFLSVFVLSAAALAQTESYSPDQALQLLRVRGEKISLDPVRGAATTQSGRIKPFDTLARESILFVTGRYTNNWLKPVQLYLALALNPAGPWAQLVEVRDVDLRMRLGYLRDKRFFSAMELEGSSLMSLAQPLFRKQEEGGKLNESEKKITETVGQLSVLKQMITGDHFIHSLDFNHLDKKTAGQPGEIVGLAQKYLELLKNDPIAANSMASELVQKSRLQAAPDLFKHYLEKLDFEVFYNDVRPFFWAALIYFLFGIVFLFDMFRKKLRPSHGVALSIIPLIPLVWGIGARVYITQFAPVTNMFSTMLWVAFGVSIFGILLFYLYRNWLVSGFIMIGSGLILMLTEQIPLVLSPDLDPLVAVLRSNFWLSTHVTTITISYAAYTIAMILGNVALVRVWTHSNNREFFREYSHYAYRMIQLGCFLLTVGIILGGIWADYSWGRFWGWDPKETWALIADMGFLVLLHARYVGWVNEFTLLAYAPVAYLLVIMAWYGVNFILATGLHSYGFSSGGAMMVAIFVSVQLVLIVASLSRYYLRKST